MRLRPSDRRVCVRSGQVKRNNNMAIFVRSHDALRKRVYVTDTVERRYRCGFSYLFTFPIDVVIPRAHVLDGSVCETYRDHLALIVGDLRYDGRKCNMTLNCFRNCTVPAYSKIVVLTVTPACDVEMTTSDFTLVVEGKSCSFFS